MKGKRFFLLLGALGVLALAIIFTRTHAPSKLPDLSQKIVKGRSISLWLQDVTERVDQSAALVLRDVADEVVPNLNASDAFADIRISTSAERLAPVRRTVLFDFPVRFPHTSLLNRHDDILLENCTQS